jgi:putative oxidoreductase
VQRLFTTFARGFPGVGLLILRLVAGIALITDGVKTLRSGPSTEAAILHALAAAAGLLMLAGLWTPIAGGVVAIVELWIASSQPGDPWIHVLLGSLGAALALIGPGAWSVDARLFGRKRIDIPDQRG